ncbi:hypothetical protein KTD31_03715 [Burkholderia multivorans]|uniref:hypothetical protein n=1 Tax=Burkholderia multivorans TaxID=87883 RepID=UPI001C21D0A8|nr:hypothetical protein [Burkholderia multivorans]MBU9200462.1 hypothetical protein [Burkholderia multivorans]MDN8078413.1 hypothetical protein [Burkholderia multivorans]
MAAKPRRSQQDLLSFLRSVPASEPRQVAQFRRQGPGAAKELQCEDFFSKLDLLLPTHTASQQEMRKLMDRMMAGRQNPPQEGR